MMLELSEGFKIIQHMVFRALTIPKSLDLRAFWRFQDYTSLKTLKQGFNEVMI